MIPLFVFKSLKLCFLLLISLVSYLNNFIYSQGHLGFNIWSVLFSLPCIKHKGRIFKFPEEKRSLSRNTCQVSFLRIPYSRPFRIILHSSLLYLSVICWSHVCSRELIFNPLISLFVFKSLMLCSLLVIYLVSYPNNFIYFQGHCGFNIWSFLLSLPCFKHKGIIFRFRVVKRSLLKINSSISFLPIPYSLKFCTVFHIYLLCFRVICLLYVCTRKLIYESVYFFVCFLSWSCVVYSSFL